MTIAVPTGALGLVPRAPKPRRSRRARLKRILIASGSALVALILIAGSWIGLSLYRIDHAVHHVGVSASLLAKGKNDLLAIVKGPDHTEQVFVFHNAGGHTNVLQIPKALGLPLKNGSTVPLGTLSLHAPSAIIAGLDRLGIPVTHYVGVDLHTVNPHSNLAKLANGKMSMTLHDVEPDRRQLAAAAGRLAHLARAGHTGVRRPVPHERAHGPPRLRPGRSATCTASSC